MSNIKSAVAPPVVDQDMEIDHVVVKWTSGKSEVKVKRVGVPAVHYETLGLPQSHKRLSVSPILRQIMRWSNKNGELGKVKGWPTIERDQSTLEFRNVTNFEITYKINPIKYSAFARLFWLGEVI